MQTTFIPVQVLHEFDSHFVGADLKRLAHGNDGNDYAIKRLEDHPLMPLCEWVGYHLSRACNIPTPDFAVLNRNDDTPAFGSRIDPAARQLTDSGAFTIAGYFAPHTAMLGAIYTLDAFLPNDDRHGRNFMLRPTLQGEHLNAFDFARGWLRTGLPMGDLSCLDNSQTSQWWAHFSKNLKVVTSAKVVDKIASLPDNWLNAVVTESPYQWYSTVDLNALNAAWQTQRITRLSQATTWLNAH